MKIDRRGAPRLRVRYISAEGGGLWYALVVDREGNELERSPGGTEIEAEKYMEHYRRYGAWLKS